MTKGKGIPKSLKRLPDGAPFPDDFWNYAINPITGWQKEQQTGTMAKAEKKRHIKPLCPYTPRG
jgi:hypothetical protein